MKRKITLSIVLALSVVLLSLMSSDSTAKAQQGGRRSNFDTGVVTLGPNQVLRVTVAWDLDNDGQALVGFGRLEYIQGNCNDGVCKHTVSPVYADNGTYTVTVNLKPGEAASMDITPTPGTSGVRGIIISNRRDVQVNALIIDTGTGKVVSFRPSSDLSTQGQ